MDGPWTKKKFGWSQVITCDQPNFFFGWRAIHSGWPAINQIFYRPVNQDSTKPVRCWPAIPRAPFCSTVFDSRSAAAVVLAPFWFTTTTVLKYSSSIQQIRNRFGGGHFGGRRLACYMGGGSGGLETWRTSEASRAGAGLFGRGCDGRDYVR